MAKSTLDTGVRLVRNVRSFNFGAGCLGELREHVDVRRSRAERCGEDARVVFFVDEFFANRPEDLSRLDARDGDRIVIVSTTKEPTTAGIDELVADLVRTGYSRPILIVGMGGGITLDTAKAVSNLLTNGGAAEQYQGWDLVKVPGIYKIGIPTISGTGAEATRTCVMTNVRSGLKLGMNSDHTVYDHLILDPEITATVARHQFFYTGMDAYIHSFESLAGSHRNAVGDAYSREAINLCRQVFLSDDMMNAGSREQLMVASYLGGCAIATSYVGVVHPFSAGLSVVLGIHHCVGNCIVMRAMDAFYPQEYAEFWSMADRQGTRIPEGVARGLSDEQYAALYDATVMHEKPLTNALGADFRSLLTPARVRSLFERM